MGFAPRILTLPWRQGQLDRQRGQPTCMNGCRQAVPGGTLPVPNMLKITVKENNEFQKFKINLKSSII